MSKERISCKLMEKINNGEPLTSKDFQNITAIAKEEIKFLSRNNIPLTPFNYYMWFEIFCYIYESGKEYSDPEIIGLFKEKYPDEDIIKETILKINKADREIVSKIASEIEKELSEVLKSLENHNKLLEKKSREFKKTIETADTKGIKLLLESVLKNIEEIKKQNCSLKEKLQESKAQVEKLSEKLKETEKNALIEFLTSIATKSSFEKVLKDIFRDYRERNYPFAVLMIKIDNFPNLVKEYSKEITDTILDEIARKLKKLLRANDVICYYDDGIFGIIVPGTTFGHAIRIGERIRKSVEELIIKVGESGFKTTVSVGISVARSDMHEDEIIDRALKAVELSEKAGGNTVKTDLDVELES
ncbi:GGDEF domain-containing protein [Desulfurobacterium atlanticum]|uniref:diguanylate cyclase n=1 Tax=Desulfurobacterium atlanticum TaxID=240169 RepID=A0A239A5X7_9BACT|nr:GGDEF domain-containing protein [Desulfurobacterium atlanticum]SNR90488.1 diguanylate cyclase [Desulfurobacterium atlanticum]